MTANVFHAAAMALAVVGTLAAITVLVVALDTWLHREKKKR